MSSDKSSPGGDQTYADIISHYEACLARHGDNHLGVDWPNNDDARTRYAVMLDLIPLEQRCGISLLDFGCGASHLYEYMQERGWAGGIHYSGLDLSGKFVELCRLKFP